MDAPFASYEANEFDLRNASFRRKKPSPSVANVHFVGEELTSTGFSIRLPTPPPPLFREIVTYPRHDVYYLRQVVFEVGGLMCLPPYWLNHEFSPGRTMSIHGTQTLL